MREYEKNLLNNKYGIGSGSGQGVEMCEGYATFDTDISPEYAFCDPEDDIICNGNGFNDFGFGWGVETGCGDLECRNEDDPDIMPEPFIW